MNHPGQCRETIIYEETRPLIVTVDVNTTTTREFVPIVNTTVLTTSWVKHKQTSLCIIRKTSTGLASGPGSGAATPAPSAASSQHPAPPAGSAEPSHNSGQAAPSAPSAHPSSGRGSGRPKYVRVDENFNPMPKEPRKRRANSSPSSSAPSSSSQQSPTGSESASGASSSG